MKNIFVLILITYLSYSLKGQDDLTKEGQFKEYYKPGGLKMEGFYKNGLPDSTWIYYDTLGNVSAIGNYKDCVYELGGVTIESIIYSCSDNSIGKKNGIWKYYNNGKLIQQTEYLCNIKIGNEKIYYNSGNIMKVNTYKNSNKLFTCSYYENGMIETIIKYKYVYDTGTHENETIQTDVIETVKEFYQAGGIASEYIEGYEGYYGQYIEYHSNGQVKLKENYHLGSCEGEHIEYYKNGRVKRISTYKNDELNGEVQIFNESGKLLITEIWEAGNLVKTQNKK